MPMAVAPSTSVDGKSQELVARPFHETFIAQTIALSAKSLAQIVGQRSRFISLFILPLLFVGAMYGSVVGITSTTYTPTSLAVQPCQAFDIYNRPTSLITCVRLAFAPAKSKTSFAWRVMERVAKASGLEMGEDVQGFASKDAVGKFVHDGLPGRIVENVVVFDNDLVNRSAHSFAYEIWHNVSLAAAYEINSIGTTLLGDAGVDERLVSLQAAIDAAIISEVGEELSSSSSSSRRRRQLHPSNLRTPRTLSTSTTSTTPTLPSSFSTTISQFTPYDRSNTGEGGSSGQFMIDGGANFFVFGMVGCCVIVMMVVSGEKTRHLVANLRSIGLLESAYFSSWYVAYAIIFMGVSLVTMAVAYITNFPIFSNTNYLVHVLALFTFSLGMLGMALCCSSFLRRPRYIICVAFGIGVAAAVIVSVGPAFGLNHAPFTPSLDPALQGLLAPWPFLYYQVMFTRIASDVYNPEGDDDSASSSRRRLRQQSSGLGTSHMASSSSPSSSMYELDWSQAWELAEVYGTDGGFEMGSSIEELKRRSSIKSWADRETSVTTRFVANVLGKTQLQHSKWIRDIGLEVWNTLSTIPPIFPMEWGDGIFFSLIAKGHGDDAKEAVLALAEEGVDVVKEGLWDMKHWGSSSLPTPHQPVNLTTPFPQHLRHLARRYAEQSMRRRRLHQSTQHNQQRRLATSSSSQLGTYTLADLTSPGRPMTVVLRTGETVRYFPHSLSWHMGNLVFLSWGYLLLAWYLSQVFTGDEGAAQPFYFVFLPVYWGCGERKKPVEAGDTLRVLQELSAREQSVRLHKVSKVFSGVQAVKELSLTLQPGELFALLGQNGSGKSTTANMIAGLQEPTNGEVFLFGKSIREDVSLLREHMGFCPQDDLLWSELSAREHVRLFARFKGVGLWGDELENKVMELLNKVNLLHVADLPVESFSGGMKRRLSVCMSAVGSPRLLQLDEPTSGQDPVSRRRVWALIEELKKDKIVILNTHDMAEAEALGDKVGILHNGRLRALGSPFYLKSHFGAGFQLSLLTSPKRVTELKALVYRYLPTAKTVGEVEGEEEEVGGGEEEGKKEENEVKEAKELGNGKGKGGKGDGEGEVKDGDVLKARAATGALTVAVPRSAVAQLPAFLRVLANFDREHEADDRKKEAGDLIEADADRLVREWSVSNSTLEEVFLRLASAEKGVNSGGVGGEDEMEMPGLHGSGGTRSHMREAAIRAMNAAATRTHGAVAWPPITLYRGTKVSCQAFVIMDDPSTDKDDASALRAGVIKALPTVATEVAAQGVEAADGGVDDDNGDGMGDGAGAAAAADGTVSAAVIGGSSSSSSLPEGGGSGRGSGEDGAGRSHGSGGGGRGGEGIRGVVSEALHAKGVVPVSPMKNEKVNPVPIVNQVLAVIVLRFHLLTKSMRTLGAYAVFVLTGTLLATLLAPPAPVPIVGIDKCDNSNVYVVDPSVCTKDGFVDWLTGAVPEHLSPQEDTIPSATAVVDDEDDDDSYGEDDDTASAVYIDGIFVPSGVREAFSCLGSQCVLPNSTDSSTCIPVLESYSYPPSIANSLNSTISYDNTTLITKSFAHVDRFEEEAPVLWYYDSKTGVPLLDWDVFGIGIGKENDGRLQLVRKGSVGGGDGLDRIEDADKLVTEFQIKLDEEREPLEYDPYDVDEVAQQTDETLCTAGRRDWSGSRASLVQWLRQNAPDGALAVSKADATPSSPQLAMDIIMWPAGVRNGVWDNSFLPSYAMWDGSTCTQGRAGHNIPSIFTSLYTPQSQTDTGIFPAFTLLNFLHTGFLRAVVREATGESDTQTLNNTYTRHQQSPSISTYIVNYPPLFYIPAARNNASVFASLLWPMFTLFLFPSFVYIVASEKREQLVSAFSMAGGRSAAYFIGTSAYFSLLYLLIGGLYVALGYASGTVPFINAGPGLFVAILLTWSYTQAGFAFLLGSTIRSPMPAAIVASLWTILVVIGGWLVSTLQAVWPREASWIPFLAYTRAGVIIQVYGGAIIEPGSELQECFLILLLEGTIAFALGLYLHRVLPRGVGGDPGVHPLFFLEWIGLQPPASVQEFFCQCRRSRSDATASEHVSQGRARVSALHRGTFDQSVILETVRTLDGDAAREVGLQEEDVDFYSGDTAAVVFRDIVKHFQVKAPATPSDPVFESALHLAERILGLPLAPRESKEAVKGLSLGVRYGEAFGLLGSNGAGKTTALSVATGALTATSGTASIGGFDVFSQLAHVHRVLGIVPQFDIVWKELTVRENLLFFCRVKGVPERRVRAEVQNVAERVQLDGDGFNTIAGALSGGMRRRLSIGIALLGNPKVVILDEPSTGLDPDNRRGIWGIIQREKRCGRAFIITTHSMSEASALCDRIGIMAHGALRCVGTQGRLRARFGDGMKLSLSLRPPFSTSLSKAQDFVLRRISPDATLVSKVGSTATFTIPTSSIDVANVFTTFEEANVSPSFPVSEWGISPASLEDVFINVINQAEAQNKADQDPSIARRGEQVEVEVA